MKYFIALLLMIVSTNAFSQIDKVDFTRSEIVNTEVRNLCKTSGNQIWYCGSHGELICYTIENEIVTKVFYMWEFDSEEAAQKNVESATEKLVRIHGKAIFKDKSAAWFTENRLLMVFYGFTNGKHYSCFSITKR